MIRRVVLFSTLALFAACQHKPKVLVTAPSGNWISLLNGKDLADWTPKIAGEPLGDNYRNTFR